MKHITTITLLLLLGSAAFAQTEPIKTKSRAYTRSSGFFIRPEAFGALGAEFGHQFSPYFQLSGGPLVSIGLDEYEAAMEFAIGVRAYASETKWTAFFDYHISLAFIDGYAIPLHRFAIGPSFKNFDFGAGIAYSLGYWGPVITLGYHIRLNKNQ